MKSSIGPGGPGIPATANDVASPILVTGLTIDVKMPLVILVARVEVIEIGPDGDANDKLPAPTVTEKFPVATL